MMALKCDNCGGYFDFVRGGRDSNGIDFIITDKNRNVNLIERKHLCPACLAAVMKALEDRKRCTVDPMEDDLK